MNSFCLANENVHPFKLQRYIHKYAATLNLCFKSVDNIVAKPQCILLEERNSSGMWMEVVWVTSVPQVLVGDGVWLYGFAGNIGETKNLHAELKVLYRSLLSAWDHGFPNLWCYFNSPNTISFIKATTNPWHEYAYIIENVCWLLAREWPLKNVLPLQEGNAYAST